jgi:hypothetical protein
LHPPVNLWIGGRTGLLFTALMCHLNSGRDIQKVAQFFPSIHELSLDIVLLEIRTCAQQHLVHAHLLFTEPEVKVQ